MKLLEENIGIKLPGNDILYMRYKAQQQIKRIGETVSK